MPGMALSQPAMPLKTVAAPWVTAAEWQAVHQTFRYLIHHHESSLNNIRVSAFRLAELLKIIILMADRLCQSTCRYCPDPCCAKAWAWFDYKDLLFMHLCGLDIPGSQTLSAPGDRCCYLGHRGCQLPRITRPWVCTWYVCPSQAARIKRKSAVIRGTFERTVGLVKQQRLDMESAFIRMTTGGTGRYKSGITRFESERCGGLDSQQQEAGPERRLPVNWL